MELKTSAGKIKLKTYDELFTTEEMRQDIGKERIEILSVDELYPFKDHPFKVLDDEKMMETAQSVKENGILVPLIVRKREEGGYEIISGHRRKRAAEIAGITEVPAMIKDMNDDEAVIAMVESNLQRENVLPSEKAFAYKMKMEAIKRTAGRPKNNFGQVDQNKLPYNARESLANDSGESSKQIHRYIRLTHLIPDILEMVDTKRMAFNPAVEVSYLNEEMQEVLYDTMEMLQATPSLSQAQRLKRFFHDGKLSREVCEAIIGEEKPQSREWNVKPEQIKRYFPKDTKPQEMERIIFRLLENWSAKRKNKDRER